MCLSIVFEKGKYPKLRRENGHKVSWKMFANRNGNLFLWVYGRTGTQLPVGKWIREEDWRTWVDTGYVLQITADDKERYGLGFHSFLSEGDANQALYQTGQGDRCIRKIYYRDVAACGLERESPVIVSREMFIVPKRARQELTLWE